MNNDLQIRTSIMELEGLLLHGFATGAVTNNEDQTALKHLFTPTDDDYGCSTYSRELFMPAGMVVVGKLHKKPHLTFLMSGTMLVVSEDGGTKRLKGPLSFVSPAGVKRAFYIEEDSTLVCVHLTTTSKQIKQQIGFRHGMDSSSNDRLRSNRRVQRQPKQKSPRQSNSSKSAGLQSVQALRGR